MKSNGASVGIAEEKSVEDDGALVKIGNTCLSYITWLFNYKDASEVIIVENISKTMLVENNIVEW